MTTGLKLVPGLTFSEWSSLATGLSMVGRWSKFAIGDWLLYGEAAYGETYAQAINELGYEYQSLANLRWVSKVFPLDARQAGLSWSIHKMAAGLPVDLQNDALQIAMYGGQNGKMTCAEFRMWCKETLQQEPIEEDPDETAPELPAFADDKEGIVRVTQDAVEVRIKPAEWNKLIKCAAAHQRAPVAYLHDIIFSHVKSWERRQAKEYDMEREVQQASIPI